MTRVSEDVYICKLEEKIGFFFFSSSGSSRLRFVIFFFPLLVFSSFYKIYMYIYISRFLLIDGYRTIFLVRSFITFVSSCNDEIVRASISPQGRKKIKDKCTVMDNG